MLPMPVADRKQIPAWLRAGSVASTLVVAVLAAGCSSSAQGTSAVSTTSTTTVASANIEAAPEITSQADLEVTSKDVHAAGEGSPYAALLRWWRALQAQDIGAARAAYAKSVDTSAVGREIRGLSFPPQLDYRGDHVVGTFALTRLHPGLVDVTRQGATTRLYTLINGAVFDRSDPSKVVFIAHTPAVFEFDRENGEWKLANDSYLAQMFKTHQEATK